MKCERKISLFLHFTVFILMTMAFGNCSWSPLQEPAVSQSAIFKESPFGALPFFSFDEPVRSEDYNQGSEHFDFSPTRDLGMKWGRAHYLTWQIVQPTEQHIQEQIYDWSDSDKVFEAYPKGFNVVENIVGFTAKVDERGEHLENFSFPSKEMEQAYIRFVQFGVERYDGDGIDDMPGLPNPIKYWQVDNEPDAKTGDWQGYANLLKITYQAIKSVCSDCKVLVGGVSYGGTGTTEKILKSFYGPALSSLEYKYFDIFDYHCYAGGSQWQSECGAIPDQIRAQIPGSYEIWATELGTWSGTPEQFGEPMLTQSERVQASAVVKFYTQMLFKKVKKIFWAWGIQEGFGPPGQIENNIFDKTGLIYDGYFSDDLGEGVKKLSYYTYKKMVELFEGSDWDHIEQIRAEDSIYIFRFQKGGHRFWVAWNENEESQHVTLSGISSRQLALTPALPESESGKEIESYQSAFKTTIQDVAGGQVDLELNDSPLFIEEI